MPNSIYDQMGAALGQASRQGQRSILYRGKVIECVVLLGNTSTKLVHGGLQSMDVVHVKIARDLVPVGQDGDPHTNEPVTYPAVETGGIIPKRLMIDEVIGEEYAWNLTLVDPTK